MLDRLRARKQLRAARLEKMTESERKHERLMETLIGGALLMSLIFIWRIGQTAWQIQKINAAIRHTQSVLVSEEAALANLEKQATRLQNEEYVLKLARSNYYLSQDGEIIYTVPEETGH